MTMKRILGLWSECFQNMPNVPELHSHQTMPWLSLTPAPFRESLWFLPADLVNLCGFCLLTL